MACGVLPRRVCAVAPRRLLPAATPARRVAQKLLPRPLLPARRLRCAVAAL